MLVETEAPRKEAPPKVRTFHPGRWVAFGVFILAAAGGYFWWRHSERFESTDDAQIEGHLDTVSSRISGTVVYINPDIENNKFVKAGTLLLELDPHDYEAELEHATASLETRAAEARVAQVAVPIADAGAFGQLHSLEAARDEAAANVETEQANLEVLQRRMQVDQETAARAERDRVRYQGLVEKHEISRSEYDARETEAATSSKAVETDRAAIVAGQRKVTQARAAVSQREAQIEGARTAPQQVASAKTHVDATAGQIQLAKADIHTANLNLSYTRIYAPASGIVGRKTVELGHRIQPGQGLMVIVPMDDIWITANFKETQLKRMHPGQAVTIHVDTFDRDYKGHVESLPGAAGPLFSLFPPENSAGNYVKVVQRFPVRIRLNSDQDPEHQLRPGMSVEPDVTLE